MGSKNKYANEILPIILKDRKINQYYVEPFVGGFNLIDKVEGNRIANDNNFYLIELFKAIKHGWKPPIKLTEDEYQKIKADKNKYPAHLVGFVGFGCSYSGKWFGGYARGNTNNGTPRNYCYESRKNILKQKEKIQNVEITNLNYLHLEIPDNSIIYCDPPYQNTTKYKDDFNHEVFWEWCRNKSKEGHTVFVSEYAAPDDFVCVKEILHKTILDKNSQYPRIEKLFRYKH
jgi:DNA adenine methylase